MPILKGFGDSKKKKNLQKYFEKMLDNQILLCYNKRVRTRKHNTDRRL
jgi:hypothetical protein